MYKILYVILREYLTRIKERPFIFTTIGIPLFMIFILTLPTYLAKIDNNNNIQKIAFFSNIKELEKKIKQSNLEIECYESINIDSIKKTVLAGNFSEAICVEIQDNNFIRCQLFFKNKTELPLYQEIEMIIQNYYLSKLYEIDMIEYIKIKNNIKLQKIQLGDNKGIEQESSIKEAMCLFLGFMVYILIFLFSTHVMRGVQEEKSSRISEVIMTSISPFQFIAGKVVGIALLGLSQIIIWFIIIFIVAHFWTPTDFPIDNITNAIQKNQYEQIQLIIEYIRIVDLEIIIPVYILFFILGFLLYSSMFAVIGSISKAEESQQLMFIVSSPLILSIILLSEVIRKPDGLVTQIFSIIPFTSPVIMVSRCVYGITTKEIIISLSILLITTICVIFIAGKIYRSTILYTGKQSIANNIIYWFNIKR